MNKLFDTKTIYLLIGVALVIAFFFLYKKQTRQARVSELGKYQGYSENEVDRHITVIFADVDNFETPVIDPSPKLQLVRDINHPSSVQLPVVRTQ